MRDEQIHSRRYAWKSVLLRVWYVEIGSDVYLLGTTASIGMLRIVLACSIYPMFAKGIYFVNLILQSTSLGGRKLAN